MRWVPHRKVERYLTATGKGFTLLRPGFFAQNLKDAYRRDIVEDDRLYVPAGAGRVAFLDVRDAGAIAARPPSSLQDYIERTVDTWRREDGGSSAPVR